MPLNPIKPTVKAMLKKVRKSGKGNELWAEVKTMLDEGLTHRRPYEQVWSLSLAFLAGKQYVFFNNSAHTLNQITKIPGRIRNTDNKLLPKWRRQVADLIKTDPRMSVVPNTLDDEDIQAANTGDKVLKAFWRNGKMRKKLRRTGNWMFSCGNSFLDDRWDKKLGPVITNPETGKLEYQGDVTAGVWSPFEIVVPPHGLGDVELNDFPWLIKIKWRNLEWIVSNYDKGKEVTSEDDAGVMNVGLFMRGRGEIQRSPGAYVLDVYIQPSATYPEGQFITASNGIVLQKDIFPLTEYGLTHFKDIEVPGQFWGAATLEQAIGPQRVWNRTLSSVDEYNRSMGKGKWIVPEGGHFHRDPDDTHGEVMLYKPVMGHKPAHADVKGLPETYPLILSQVERTLDDLFSQHEVTRGTNKSDIRSGEMVSILREQDAHGNIPAHAVFEEGLEAFASRVLKRIAKGYSNERILSYTGKEGESELFAFKGADLRNNTDVSVKRESTFADSRTARESLVLRKAEMGLYGDLANPDVRRHIMNMLEDAVVEDIYSDTRLDEANARYENRIIISGKLKRVLTVNAYDNHGVHANEHNHHRKKSEYQKLKLKNPKLFMLIDTAMTAHLQQHQRFIEEARRKMMAEQAAMKGTTTKGGNTR